VIDNSHMHSHLLSAWITMLILTAGFPAGNSQDGEALVCTDPVRLEIGAGQIETLQILLMNADKIYGIDLQATFDPAVVEVVDADSEQTGVQMQSGVFPKPDFSVRNLADNKTGTLRYVVTQLKPTPPASGTGIILMVHFLGKTQGSSSKLTFTTAVIADRRGNKQPVTTRWAELVIVAPKPSTPTPHPTHTPHPTRTSIPTVPALLTPSLTPVRAQPTAQPSPTTTWNNVPSQASKTATKNNPLSQPNATTVQKIPAGVSESDPAAADRILTYVTVGGFSSAMLLFGLTLWQLAAKRRKNPFRNYAPGEVPAPGESTPPVPEMVKGQDGESNPGVDDKEGIAQSK
jgi:hypothetical protein